VAAHATRLVVDRPEAFSGCVFGGKENQPFAERLALVVVEARIHESRHIARAERRVSNLAELRSLLLEEKWLEGLADVVAAADVPVYLAGREVLDAATGYAVHRGALAAMSRTALPPAAELVEGASRLAVLEDVARSVLHEDTYELRVAPAIADLQIDATPAAYAAAWSSLAGACAEDFWLDVRAVAEDAAMRQHLGVRLLVHVEDRARDVARRHRREHGDRDDRRRDARIRVAMDRVHTELDGRPGVRRAHDAQQERAGVEGVIRELLRAGDLRDAVEPRDPGADRGSGRGRGR
jgi:hypothetical protein